MKISPVVKKETGTIALGTVMLCLIMLAVYTFLGKLDPSVFLGTALGFIAAVGNFFLMALSVQKSAEKMNGVVLPPVQKDENGEEADSDKNDAVSPEAKEIKKFMRASYTGRMLLLVLVAILAVNVKIFDTVACLVVLLFPRIVVFVVQFIRKKKEGNAA